MPSRERVVHVGARRGVAILHELGIELREARIAAGLTLREVASAVGITRQYLARIERGVVEEVPLTLLARLSAVVGLRLSARAYPAGPPLRDAGHLALLQRFRAILPDGTPMRMEVPVVDQADGRAWDTRIQLGDGHLNVEAETRIRDVQALERRIALKQMSDPPAPVVLLASDTKTNRSALRAAAPLLRERFPLGSRQILRVLRQGRCPSESGIILL